jgi:HlyD family secretion protein
LAPPCWSRPPSRAITSGGRPAARRPRARPAPSGPRAVTALGRLQPKDGIIRVAGPRADGRHREAAGRHRRRRRRGQPLAILDTQAENEARVARVKAELVNAETELGRVNELFRQGIAAVSLRESGQLKVDVARAEMRAAQSTLDLDTVRAPIAGQVIAVHARRGERVGMDGIAELADTAHMYAVAEVYETDIGRVKIGQRASVRSPAVDGALTGVVERIGMKIGKLDVLDTDPAARTGRARRPGRHPARRQHARRGLSNLQVEVAIQPDS